MSDCKKCQKIYEEKCQIYEDHNLSKVDNFWIDRHHTLWNVAQDIIDKLTLEIDQLKIKRSLGPDQP